MLRHRRHIGVMAAVTPALGLSSDEVTHLLTAAGRAPSVHNTQPWRFRVQPDVIELWADPERALPAADPSGRELRVACGAALYNLRLALQGCGVRPLVTLPADPERPDFLASVRYGGRKAPTPAQLRLLAAVPKRHTNRRPFTDEPVSAGERNALRRAALEESAWLHFVDDRASATRCAPQRAGAHDPAGGPGVPGGGRTLDGGHGGQGDGVPAYANEQRPAAHETWVKRTSPRAAAGPPRPWDPLEQEPAIAVISPYTFGGSANVTAGQAMRHVLLTATVEGLAVSFLSQVVEVEQNPRPAAPPDPRKPQPAGGAAHRPRMAGADHPASRRSPIC